MAAEARSAWLFDFGADLRAAVGGQHLAEYLRAPQVMEIPLTPAHTRGVLVWRERLVPLIDLARLVDGEAGSKKFQERPQGAIVLAYRDAPDAPLQYGALALASAPREIGVRDDLACDLPISPAFWAEFTASCITYENRPLPILRVRQLFTQAFATKDAPVRATRALNQVSTVTVAPVAPVTASIGPVSTRETHALAVVATRPDEIPDMTIVETASVAPASLFEDALAAAPLAEISGPLDEPRATFAAQAGAAASRTRTHGTSNTVLSFRHLHASARQYETPRWLFTQGGRWLRHALVAMVALAMLVLTWNLSMDSGKSPSKLAADAPQLAAKDIAPNGIAAGSEPSSPAQPPK